LAQQPATAPTTRAVDTTPIDIPAVISAELSQLRAVLSDRDARQDVRDDAAIKLVSQEMAAKHQVVPMSVRGSTLIVAIAGSFAIQILLARPDMGALVGGFIPQTSIVTNPEMLYIALGILGATVMPHNLYLHSSIVQTRRYADTLASKKEAIRFATLDSSIALMSALFINAAILIVSAAVFHGTEHESVADIGDAHQLLSPLLGTSAAGILFAVALLCSGQNATLTGTLAGQIVMEGFVNIRLRPWLRRLITRLVAIVPAVIVVSLYGERGTGALLILSQVILSLQLPFAVFPLVSFTGNRLKMGVFVAPRWVQALAWTVAVIIAALNVWLLYQTILG